MSWAWFHRFGSAPYFYRVAGTLTPWFAWPAGVLIAFGPALIARGVVDLLLVLQLERDEALRARLPDVTFWASRLLTTLTLAVLVL